MACRCKERRAAVLRIGRAVVTREPRPGSMMRREARFIARSAIEDLKNAMRRREKR